MIPAFQKNEDLLADIRSRRGSGGLDIWWLGQSGYLVRYGEMFLLLDPYMSDSLTRKYADTDKPHIRMSELVIEPQRLDFIDVVTASHAHTDHLDPETLAALFRVNDALRLIAPASIIPLAAERAGISSDQVKGLNAGDFLDIGDLTIRAIPAAHNELDVDAYGRNLYLGYIISACGWSIYHSGDTLLYPGMEDWIRPWKPDLAFLPINGHDPKRRVAGNLNAQEAVQLSKAIGVQVTIPCHYDMFYFNTADVGEFILEAEAAGLGYQVLRPGERFSYPLD